MGDSVLVGLGVSVDAGVWVEEGMKVVATSAAAVGVAIDGIGVGIGVGETSVDVAVGPAGTLLHPVNSNTTNVKPIV